MTDEQIKKALECCSKGFGNCEGCPYDNDHNDCVTLDGRTLIFQDALDLINRKDAEIERLNNELVSADEVIGFREAEIERLKEYETALKKGCALSRCINKGFVQDEAYKEFAERLKAKATSTFYEEHKYVDTEDIDEVLEELTEGGNEPPKNDFKE